MGIIMINQKYHDKIFRRFHLLNNAGSGSLGGTGFALFIVKNDMKKDGS